MKRVVGIKNGRLARWQVGMAAMGVGAMLVSACTASAAQGTNSGANSAEVVLSPPSGSEGSTPTWSTHAACPSGFRGSAIFRAIRTNGSTYSISPATNTVTAPFKGTLLASIAEIQDFGGIANGATEKYIIICFSGDSLTGQSHQEMSMFVTYSANGESYKSSSTG
jgi:hypothetical protein